MTAALAASAQLAEDLTWPLWEQPRRFELGHILNCAVSDALRPPSVGALGVHHAGLWECDLNDNSLIWSGGSYDIFGLARNVNLTREICLAHYAEHSRATLEALRTDAIRRKRGFTLDVEIRAASVGDLRWVRIIGAPVCSAEQVVRLHGLKLII